MASKKKQQEHFDRFVREQRGKRYPDVVGTILKEAGYRPYLMRRLDWALNGREETDDRLSKVAEDCGLNFTPTQAKGDHR